MRAFIHGFQGQPWNADCGKAAEGFRKLGIETVLFTTNEEFDQRKPEDVIVGSTIFVRHALDKDGISLEQYDYPEELKDFLGRRVWDTKLKDIRKEKPPFFMKPAEDKLAPAVVIRTWEELPEYFKAYETLEPETDIHCSELVNFISEWRCFLLYGRIIGLEFYCGSREAECDRNVIEKAVSAYPGMPAGFALDFGVTDDGRTLLIEANDGFSLGVYGLEDTLYARLLAARWAQIYGTEDELGFLSDTYAKPEAEECSKLRGIDSVILYNNPYVGFSFEAKINRKGMVEYKNIEDCKEGAIMMISKARAEYIIDMVLSEIFFNDEKEHGMAMVDGYHWHVLFLRDKQTVCRFEGWPGENPRRHSYIKRVMEYTERVIRRDMGSKYMKN